MPGVCARYLKSLEAKKPVVFTGDLNVAHLDLDIYNYAAPHIKKSAGCTARERDSFSSMLSRGTDPLWCGYLGPRSQRPIHDVAASCLLPTTDAVNIAGFVDTFRHQHKDVAGAFT